MNFNSPPPNGMNMPPCNQFLPWPQHQQGPYLAQPPFMPPNVVGNLEPCWTQPPPFLSTPLYQEQNHSFPFSPNRQQQQPKRHGKRHSNSNNAPSFAKKAKSKEPTFIDFCDVCDRGFKNEERKKQHYAEHTVCTEPGCSFEAHYKIVEIHKRNLHGPNGVKINLSTPEEISKWREERKKNFPTSIKVKEKLEEGAKKISSGAVLQEQSFGKFRNGKKGNRFQNGGRGQFKNRNENAPPIANDVNPNVDVQTENPSSNPADADDKSSNPLDALIEPPPTSQERPGKTSFVNLPLNGSVQSTGTALDSLSQLMTSYVTDDDDVSDDDVDAKTSTDAGDSKNSQPSVITEPNLPPITKSLSRGPTKRDNKENRHKRNQKPPPRSRLSKPSLLQMLLEPEIRKERNDILQCVRYIVQNNFFEAVEE